VLALSCFATVATAGDVVHVIVMAGQSNMVGGASLASLSEPLQPWAEAMPEVAFRQWLNGSEYGSSGWSEALSPRNGLIGPEMSFAHRLAQARPDESVAILKVAYNGTNLGCDWAPDGCGYHLYNKLKLLTQYWIEDLEKTGVTCRLAGLVWIQGESDSRTSWAATSYFDNFKLLVESLRIDTHRPFLPVVAVRVYPRGAEYQYSWWVRAAMRDLSTVDPWVDSVGIGDLSLMSDHVHLTADSMVRTGIRAADSFLALGCLDTIEEAPNCWGDFDGDDEIAVSDLLQLLEGWGPCGP
jgi:hypothetical protein